MSESQKEKILLSFSIEPDHSKATLDLYLGKYPEFASEILDLAYEIEIVTTPATSISSTENTKETRLKDVLSGESLNQVSEKMSLPKDFLMGFRDRIVRLESIPQKFIRCLLYTS